MAAGKLARKLAPEAVGVALHSSIAHTCAIWATPYENQQQQTVDDDALNNSAMALFILILFFPETSFWLN